MIALPPGFDLKCNEGPRDEEKGSRIRRGWVGIGDPAGAMLDSYNELTSRIMTRDERRRMYGEGEETKEVEYSEEAFTSNSSGKEKA